MEALKVAEDRSQPDARQKLHDDALMMEQVARGDVRARRRLVVQLGPRVERMARHMSANEHEVDGLRQDVLVQVLRSASTYRGEGCVEAWADRIAVRTILKRSGRERRRPRPVDLTELPADGGRADEEYLDRERSECVSQLLAQLPADERMALVLKLVLGHSVDEVSQIMDRSVWSVRYLLRRGRSRMRDLAAADERVTELFTWRRP